MTSSSPSSRPLVRPARQAGRFYEADPGRLRAMIEAFLAAAPVPDLGGPPVALLAPHAGYVYSGHVAAAAFRQLAGRPVDGVLLLAPSHYADLPGAALPTAEAFATPLGDVALDREALAFLARHPGFAFADAVHDPEHSIEVELPFCQVALGRPFALAPLALGCLPPGEGGLAALADPLEALLRQRAAAGQAWMILVSSDTYHGYDPEACVANDAALGSLLERMATRELLEAARARRVMACGWVGLVLALELARRLGAHCGVVMKRADSRAGAGPVSDYVVGYLAAAFV
jgi:AmmeMemoRadiSam system protein B